MGEERTKQVKTYGSIIYRGTVTLDDLAEHIMQHGTVFIEDVVVGLIAPFVQLSQREARRLLCVTSDVRHVASYCSRSARREECGHCGDFFCPLAWRFGKFSVTLQPKNKTEKKK